MSAKVHFIVSSGMTKYDIKNYLEKIYKVPVADVRTLNKMGKTRQNAFGSYIVKDDDYKMAYVTLPPGMLTVFSNGQFKTCPSFRTRIRVAGFKDKVCDGGVGGGQRDPGGRGGGQGDLCQASEGGHDQVQTGGANILRIVMSNVIYRVQIVNFLVSTDTPCFRDNEEYQPKVRKAVTEII